MALSRRRYVRSMVVYSRAPRCPRRSRGCQTVCRRRAPSRRRSRQREQVRLHLTFSAHLANLSAGFSHIDFSRTIKIGGAVEANNWEIRLIGDPKARKSAMHLNFRPAWAVTAVAGFALLSLDSS